MDEDDIRGQMAVLMQEHRDLDDAITAVTRAGTFDLLQVQRLKKRKLMLKDEIAKLKNMLVPDIIA
ncbi:YdcH family protein [Kordiimonas sp.]|uniref:YdcH family protein n=1 Tax=Kordiimonas sp. TaxID=1970157 RepID=UPI003A90FBD0